MKRSSKARFNVARALVLTKIAVLVIFALVFGCPLIKEWPSTQTMAILGGVALCAVLMAIGWALKEEKIHVRTFRDGAQLHVYDDGVRIVWDRSGRRIESFALSAHPADVLFSPEGD